MASRFQITYRNKFYPILLCLLFLPSCSSIKIDPEQALGYGKLRYSKTTNSKNFSLVITEDFKEEDESKRDNFHKKMTEKEVALLTSLLKYNDYCIEKDEETGENINTLPYFLIKKKQPAAYQILPQANYANNKEASANKIMIVPTTFFGQCIAKDTFLKIKEAEEKIDTISKEKDENIDKTKNKVKDEGKDSKNIQNASLKKSNSQNIRKTIDIKEQKQLLKLKKKAVEKRRKEARNNEKKARKKFQKQMKKYRELIKEDSKDSDIIFLF